MQLNLIDAMNRDLVVCNLKNKSIPRTNSCECDVCELSFKGGKELVSKKSGFKELLAKIAAFFTVLGVSISRKEKIDNDTSAEVNPEIAPDKIWKKEVDLKSVDDVYEKFCDLCLFYGYDPELFASDAARAIIKEYVLNFKEYESNTKCIKDLLYLLSETTKPSDSTYEGLHHHVDIIIDGYKENPSRALALKGPNNFSTAINLKTAKDDPELCDILISLGYTLIDDRECTFRTLSLYRKNNDESFREAAVAFSTKDIRINGEPVLNIHLLRAFADIYKDEQDEIETFLENCLDAQIYPSRESYKSYKKDPSAFFAKIKTKKDMAIELQKIDSKYPGKLNIDDIEYVGKCLLDSNMTHEQIFNYIKISPLIKLQKISSDKVLSDIEDMIKKIDQMVAEQHIKDIEPLVTRIIEYGYMQACEPDVIPDMLLWVSLFPDINPTSTEYYEELKLIHKRIVDDGRENFANSLDSISCLKLIHLYFTNPDKEITDEMIKSYLNIDSLD